MGWVHNPCKCEIGKIPELKSWRASRRDGRCDRRGEGEKKSRESMRMLDGNNANSLFPNPTEGRTGWIRK